MTTDQTFNLGYFKRLHSFNGELVAVLDSDDPTAYLKTKAIFLLINERLMPFFVQKMTLKNKKEAILKLEDIDTQPDAEKLIGCSIYLPLTELPALKANQFYYFEILGYQVIDKQLGDLGTISNYYETTHQTLLEFIHQDKEILFPINDTFLIKTDKANKILHVDLPNGLLDIYLHNGSSNPNEPDED